MFHLLKQLLPVEGVGFSPRIYRLWESELGEYVPDTAAET